MKQKLTALLLGLAMTAGLLTGCTGTEMLASSEALKQQMTAGGYFPSPIGYEFMGKAEASEVMLSHEEYFGKLNQNDLDLRMQKKNATLEEFKEFSAAQTLDFTEEEAKAVADSLDRVQTRMHFLGYDFPLTDQIKFIKETMKNEQGASAYTLGKEIYLSEEVLTYGVSKNKQDRNYFDETIAHEIFHILSRNVPEFRESMYRQIGFTVDEKEPEFSAQVKKQIIANPDVESYDCHGTFTIDGKPVDAVIVTYREGSYQEGDTLFEVMKAGLVPINKPNRIIPISEVPDFYDVVGKNTGYVIAAEECMAENFCFAVTYGEDGDYQSPEIIKGIIETLKQGCDPAAYTAAQEEMDEEEVFAEQPEEKDVTTLAKEVIRGKWGNGPERVKLLTEAGYDAAAVQAEVNKLLK